MGRAAYTIEYRTIETILRRLKIIPGRSHYTLDRRFHRALATMASKQFTRAFSNTSICRSKIGSAPLSLPPEVRFTILPPPMIKAGRDASRNQPGSTVEVEGPLGKMQMPIPAYMSIQENAEARTRTLSILDAEDRKQRQMWGMCSEPISLDRQRALG